MKVTLVGYTPRPLYVCAEAAAVCYDSEPSLNIVKGCIRSGHCYDADTEVLTENGFIKWSQVTTETKIANINPADRSFIGFKKPLALIAYQYEGNLINFKNKYIDLNITPEHKIYCSQSNTSYNRTNPSFELIPANKYIECVDKRYNNFLYKKPLRMVTSAINTNTTYGNPIYKLYGFFIGDGYCVTDNSKICFHLKKQKKIDYLKLICQENNLILEEHANNKYCIKINGFRSLFYNDKKEKTFPNTFFYMSKEDFNYFLDGLINSDGSIGKTSLQYDTTSVELKDKLSALFSLNDIMFTVTKKESNNIFWKDLYTIMISLKNKYPLFNDSRSKKYAEEIQYSGMVYCAEVDSGLIIVRKNDKVVLCGNCSVLEHCSFTFRVEGISRSCSNQIVRHRIASYSQQSQRYVKYDNLDWVIPDYGIDEGYARHACDIMLNAYKEMTDESDPDFQKSTIDAARCVLPNATPTIIYVTMNLRALMHFCNERMCNRASKEIHEVASLMRDEVMGAQEISFEEKKILDTILVPKCMAGPIHACPERDGCGKFKPLKEFVWRAKGRWIGINEWAEMHDSKPSGIGTYFWCSKCEESYESKSKFCPNCGAEMMEG